MATGTKPAQTGNGARVGEHPAAPIDPKATPELGEPTEPRIEYVPADLPVITRNEVTDRFAASMIALGQDGGGVDDLIMVGAVDGIMQLLLEHGLTTEALATPKVGHYRDLTARRQTR